ncbi:PAS domain-containing sensor histidine kinase [Caulobacter sp. S45]|uniref:sensor histidine kinase n=1 Tax=Caulobacter sp. S45 TaxID=1641861 RepID=UPI00131B5CA9|nr:ATP-binding protein [Caulobacter sp. S45]
MGFKRVVLLGLGQVLLFACGVGATVSIQAGLYACALALALTALWLGASAAWAGRPSPPMRAAPPMPDMEAVRADQRLLRSLIDQTPAPLLMLHPDGVITAGNRAARTLFRTDDRLVAPPTALTEALKAGASGGRLTVELVAETSRRTYAMSLADLAGPHGTIRLAALLDIQPEIHAAEAAALRDLMQVLSHEIMNALTPVASLAATATELLADETPASLALARDAVATLARRAEGLMRFVDAYRTLARLPPPDPKPTSLAGLMEETARLFRSRWEPRGVRLELTCPSPDVVLELDADLAIHALSNILSNGAEAALETPARTPTVRFAAQTDPAGATLTISDSGPGVSREHRERIFQSFFTTKPEGAGVGLSFARQVALSHGGDLTLSAQAPGEGAVFLMRL